MINKKISYFFLLFCYSTSQKHSIHLRSHLYYIFQLMNIQLISYTNRPDMVDFFCVHSVVHLRYNLWFQNVCIAHTSYWIDDDCIYVGNFPIMIQLLDFYIFDSLVAASLIEFNHTIKWSERHCGLAF